MFTFVVDGVLAAGLAVRAVRFLAAGPAFLRRWLGGG
jgi:hypothetical protein